MADFKNQIKKFEYQTHRIMLLLIIQITELYEVQLLNICLLYYLKRSQVLLSYQLIFI